MSRWPIVPLACAIQYHKEFIQIDDLEDYKRCRVQLHAQGIILRDTVTGSEIKTKKQQVCKAGDFLVAEIDAKVGGFGIVPEQLDQAIVSSHYFLFGIEQARLDRRFLDFYIRTPAFRDQVAAQGSTNYAAIRPNDVLGYKIPPPPLPEQRRIVARIESLAAKIEETKSFRDQADKETGVVFDSFLNSVLGSENWVSRLLSDVAAIARGKFGYRPRNDPRFYGGQFPFIQIGDISNSNRYIRTYSQTLNDAGMAISRMFPKGTIVIAITGATIGVTGILTFDSCFPDSIVGIQAKTEVVIPEFIYLAIEHAKKKALAEATQTTQPNINLGNLERLRVVVPQLSEQRRIVSEFDTLQAKVDALKKLQAESAAELAALLPSILDKAFRGEL